jgi:hypothetical protein
LLVPVKEEAIDDEDKSQHHDHQTRFVQLFDEHEASRLADVHRTMWYHAYYARFAMQTTQLL